jgi:hypothetical protein
MTPAVRRWGTRKKRGLPVAGSVEDADVPAALAAAAHPITPTRSTGPITRSVLRAPVDAAVVVVMPQIPGHPRQGGSTAPPTHSGTGSDEHSYSLPKSLMVMPVTTCRGAPLHRHNVIA